MPYLILVLTETELKCRGQGLSSFVCTVKMNNNLVTEKGTVILRLGRQDFLSHNHMVNQLANNQSGFPTTGMSELFQRPFNLLYNCTQATNHTAVACNIQAADTVQ